MSISTKLLIFGEAAEYTATTEIIGAMPEISGHDCKYYHIDDLENIDKVLVDISPTLLVVIADGAKGMECVYRAREHNSELPVFWFSNDKAFAVQSYRFNCAYFAEKPVTADKLANAIKRCSHMGIQIFI